MTKMAYEDEYYKKWIRFKNKKRWETAGQNTFRYFLAIAMGGLSVLPICYACTCYLTLIIGLPILHDRLALPNAPVLGTDIHLVHRHGG